MTGATHALDSCTKAIGRRRTASHLVSPSRLQVARQSNILEVSHIHLCDWRRSLGYARRTGSRPSHAVAQGDNFSEGGRPLCK